MALTNYFHPIMMLLTGTTSDQCSTIATQSWACDQYLGQLIYAVLYGVTSAAYVLLTTLVLADLLGADAFTNAFGLLLLFQGVATFIGPPVVGAMFDVYNSYNPGFLGMGLMIAASGAMLYPIPCIKRHLARRDHSGKRAAELDPGFDDRHLRGDALSYSLHKEAPR